MPRRRLRPVCLCAQAHGPRVTSAALRHIPLPTQHPLRAICLPPHRAAPWWNNYTMAAEVCATSACYTLDPSPTHTQGHAGHPNACYHRQLHACGCTSSRARSKRLCSFTHRTSAPVLPSLRSTWA